MSTSEKPLTTILTHPQRVRDLGTILGIWAHPDDEAYLAGGLMALAVGAGERVVCVTATRGELGTSDPQRWPPTKLAEERTAELHRSLETLGVEEHVWLDYPDGACREVSESEPVARLTDIIVRVRPKTVLTFGPDGMTGHADHVAVSRWTTFAFEGAALPGCSLHYSTYVPEWLEMWKPVADSLNVMMDESLIATTPRAELSIDLRVPDDVLELKFEALRAQETQTSILIDAVGEDDFRALIAHERYRPAPAR